MIRSSQWAAPFGFPPFMHLPQGFGHLQIAGANRLIQSFGDRSLECRIGRPRDDPRHCDRSQEIDIA